MYRLPSSSQTLDPEAFLTKKGVDPTEPKARTGLFTPPGISVLAVSNSSRERFRFMEAPGIIALVNGKWQKASSLRPVPRNIPYCSS